MRRMPKLQRCSGYRCGILLDTHLILWYAKGDRRMPPALMEAMADPGTAIFANEVPVLEIAVKHAKNPAAIPNSDANFVRLCEEARFALRPLALDAVLAYESLSFDKVGDLHKDPFDRLPISQAKTEGLTLATHDRILAPYGEPAVRVYP